MSVYEHMLKVASEYGGPSLHKGDEELCWLIASFTGRSQSTKSLLMFHDFRVIDKQVGYRPKSGGKHRVGKTGRMIKQVLGDYISDIDLEQISSEVKNQFLLDTDSWVLTEGTDFEDAFRGEFQKEAYFDTTEDCKSQNNSCMRYDYVKEDGYPAHPATAYNSGDFRVATLKDEDGLYLARTVICNLNNSRGPIYCVNKKAYKVLDERLSDAGVYQGGEGDWIGARMVDIPYVKHGDHYKVIPYLDLYPASLKYNDDKSALVITKGTGRVVSATSANGISEYFPPKCKVCSEESLEDVCEACAQDNYVVCDYSGRYVRAKDCFLKWNNRDTMSFVHEDYLHRYVSTTFWTIEDGQVFDTTYFPEFDPSNRTFDSDVNGWSEPSPELPTRELVSDFAADATRYALAEYSERMSNLRTRLTMQLETENNDA